MRGKKTISIVVALIISSGFVFDIFAGGDADVIFSNLQWDCPYSDDERQCDVSFELVNITAAPQVRKINIRGISAISGNNDESVQICGQLFFSILLEPHEVVVIREMLSVTTMPDNIKVLIWE